jgi:hypothetical protein
MYVNGRKSYRVVGSGGPELREEIRRQGHADRIVRLITTDAEFPLCHLIREEKDSYRILARVGNIPGDPNVNGWRSGPQRWEVLDVDKQRITDMVRMN